MDRFRHPYMGHQPYIELALATGLRSGELTALSWKDHVNLQVGTLDVVANHWNGEPSTRKTGRRDRLYLSPGLVCSLGQHWRRMQKEGSKDQIKSGLVFPSVTGLYATNRVRRALRWSCRQAGLPKMVPHDLRHTAATLWNQVTSRRVAQLAIGHDDSRTHDHYTHPYEEDFRRGSVAVATLIGADKPAEVASSAGHLGGPPSKNGVSPIKETHAVIGRGDWI